MWSSEIYSLSLHAALPICARVGRGERAHREPVGLQRATRVEAEPAEPQERRARDRHRQIMGLHRLVTVPLALAEDRKSTRLNSSHITISYAVLCLKT